MSNLTSLFERIYEETENIKFAFAACLVEDKKIPAFMLYIPTGRTYETDKVSHTVSKTNERGITVKVPVYKRVTEYSEAEIQMFNILERLANLMKKESFKKEFNVRIRRTINSYILYDSRKFYGVGVSFRNIFYPKSLKDNHCFLTNHPLLSGIKKLFIENYEIEIFLKNGKSKLTLMYEECAKFNPDKFEKRVESFNKTLEKISSPQIDKYTIYFDA